MEFLTNAFPEAINVLQPSGGVESDEDYIKAEQFCMKATGVRYDGIPRPEFFTKILYPRFIYEPPAPEEILPP
jgi:hypothetical protein